MNVIKSTLLITLIGAAFASTPASADRVYIVKHGPDKREYHRNHSGKFDNRRGHKHRDRKHGDREPSHSRRAYSGKGHRRDVLSHPTIRPHISLQLGSVSVWHDRRFGKHFGSNHRASAYRRGFQEGYREGYREARRKQHRRSRRY